ncbi:Mitotic spindle assembly checkpoint protein MAD1 [Gracilariopsis chorda]|uniref:Mitotic spindle assembly checkpoint protein MAD1 n=1 Tax=Gracilariopsis chorda TaxID=448386 RepID=A0A2V3J2P7_9FLOR|nr:Mitotic spindle assembly checkpoint protein MAD1 [Gracilariopsis chorda]|eukprot:PXF48382.1 Mitotic spindle assembly checkpoint protein MAD1 [Gracilariopsis chorda]
MEVDDDNESHHPSTDEVWLRVDDTIRSLQSDVRVLQDPAVRTALQTPTATPRSPAELNAAIVSLRTELSLREKKLREEKQTTLVARQRAARAEGEILAFRRERAETSTLHENAVQQAAERITQLEKQLADYEHSVNMQRVRERDQRQRDRMHDNSFAAEREMYNTQIQMADAKIRRLERELTSLGERFQVQNKQLQDRYNLALTRADRLEKEKEQISTSRISFSEVRDRNITSLQENNRSLEAEVYKLRTQLRDQTQLRARTVEKLVEMESAVDRLREQCREAESKEENSRFLSEEITLLRIQASEEERAQRNASTLQSEKEELTRLICALSPTGDAQEGIRTLRSLALTQADSGSVDMAQRVAMQQYEVRLAAIEQQNSIKAMRIQDQLDDCKRRLVEMDAENKQVKSDWAAALDEKRRYERGRRILQREVEHLRAALREIEEVEIEGTPNVDDGRWRRRVKAAEDMLAECRSAMGNMEKELQSKQKQIVQLRSKGQGGFGSQASSDQQRVEMHNMERKLASEVSRRMQTEKQLETLSLRLKEAETSLEQTLAVNAALPPDNSPLDYDPTKVKVVHLADNPLTQAILDHAMGKSKEKTSSRQVDDGDVDMSDGANSEILQLKKHINELEKENANLTKNSKVGLRTKEIAMKKIGEVRSAVYNLLGWSMKMAGAKYTLGSIYAESPNEILEFGINENGTFALMQNHYTNQLTEEIEQYVRKMDSVPSLLAQITMENIEKTTLMNV